MGLFDRLWGRQRDSEEARQSHRPADQEAQVAADAHAVDEVRQTVAALLGKQDASGALRQLDDAIRRWPGHAELLLMRASLHRQQGRVLLGIADAEAALEKAARPADVHLELAQCWLARPDLEAAIDALHVAVSLDETHGAAWLALGETWRRMDQQGQAQEAYREAIRHLERPQDRASAWFLLGQSLMVEVKVEEAREAFVNSLASNPDLVESHIGMGNAALWLDDDLEAVRHFEVAMRLSSRPGRLLLLNYGAALQNAGRLEDAHRVFQRVLAEQPRDHASRWYLCQLDLALCRWEQAWPNYASRFGSGATVYRPLAYAGWDGTASATDTLLVMADEGLGDEILYASCLPEAASRVAQVIVECEMRLESLFRRSFPQVHVVGTRRENDPSWLAGLPTPTRQIPSGDLPSLFRRSDDQFPDHKGYLKADPARVAHWREKLAKDLGPGLKVGISWRGGTIKTRARARSLQPQHWAEILAVPGVHFINLQYGDYQGELETLRSLHGVPIHDHPEVIPDYDETAALVSSLDLVITVCTAIVHLAGALGKPVWVLTPLSPGWRYTAHRQHMPWYPSSTLFRQKTWGEWTPACQEVSVALAELTKKVAL